MQVTDSGINVQAWRDRLLAVHTAAGRNEGPAFCDTEGFLMATADMNTMLWEGLEEVYANGYASFFPIAVTDKTKISELIQVYRSCRRTS